MGELVIILLIVLVVFGANKLPGIGDALGRSIKNFKRASKGAEDEDEKDKKDEKAEIEEKKPAQIAGKPQKQLESSGDDDEWEEVVVRRRKKSASSSES
jgi:sec-independent protein translocase protein TatA